MGQARKQRRLIILLRRPESPFILMELRPQHLDPSASYEVEMRTTYDRALIREMKGRDFARMRIQLAEAPSSTLIFYRQK